MAEENKDQETAEQPKKAAKKKTIKVRSTQKEPAKNGSWERAFWERHADHPEGEVWIADGEIHEVAETPKVREAISKEKLEEVK